MGSMQFYYKYSEYLFTFKYQKINTGIQYQQNIIITKIIIKQQLVSTIEFLIQNCKFSIPSLVPPERAPSLKLAERAPSINLQNQTEQKQENNYQVENVKLSEPEQIRIDVRQEEIQIKMHQKVEAKPVQQAPASFLDSLYGGLMDNTKKKGRRK
ncbi:Hypothetical_protein [Hexamita inflata]|uniref:Hypothetical_protein n=1 Tax=Hexamita inflata TaxID=28002 RepID=A0AA86NHT4_9EUKA|nr:Hypothetical protein HINF_LOCUS7872 [Hexamita inflata]